MSKDLKIKNISISDLALIVTAIVALISLVRSCNQETQIKELALQYRPLLKTAAKPHITSFQFHSNKISIQQLKPDTLWGDSLSAIELPCSLFINTNLRITNIGNSLAKITAFIWTDTLSGKEKIRDILKHKELRKNILFNSSGFDYFEDKEILPNDTADFEASQIIQFADTNNLTLHYVIMYMGENGVLYDTYYWAKYRMNPMLVQIQYGKINGEPVIRFIYPKRMATKDVFVLQKDNSSYKTYTMNESNDIRWFFKNQLQIGVSDSIRKNSCRIAR